MMNLHHPTLKILRESISQQQRSLLDEIWQYFLTNNDWPIAWEFHSPNRKTAIRAAFKSLNGNIVREVSDSTHGSRYELTLLGAILTTNGIEIEKVLIRYLEFLRKRYQTLPKIRIILSAEAQSELELDDEQTKFLGRLVVLGNIFNSSASYDPKGLSKEWSAGMLHEVEDFPFDGKLDGEFENFVLRNLNTNIPVFLDERNKILIGQQAIAQTSPDEIGNSEVMTKTSIMPKEETLIFVSHSNFDKKIADMLVDLLCRALNLRVANFICTSVDGAKLRGGDQTDVVLRHAIRDVPLFLSILTPEAIASTYVLFELGARWGTEKSHIPLIAKGSPDTILKDPLKATNALMLSRETDIFQLVHNTAEILELKPQPPQSFHQKIQALAQLTNTPLVKVPQEIIKLAETRLIESVDILKNMPNFDHAVNFIRHIQKSWNPKLEQVSIVANDTFILHLDISAGTHLSGVEAWQDELSGTMSLYPSMKNEKSGLKVVRIRGTKQRLTAVAFKTLNDPNCMVVAETHFYEDA